MLKIIGIPQNRERVYTISIRKDIDSGNFTFPEKEELKIRLKDVLEENVDEKYYLDDKQIKRIKTSTFANNSRRIQEKDYCDTSCARDWKNPKCIQVGELDMKGHEQMKRFYSPKGLCPTLTTMGGGQREPKIIDDIYNNRELREYAKYSPTLRSEKFGLKAINNFRIRKLTPKECWRLMGFDDEDFDKIQAIPISNTQLYKMAGNSIVVNVLEKIFFKILWR